MRRKILFIGAAVVAILIVMIGAALLYVSFADLSGWRPTVERVVSDVLGRELTISGDFALDVGLTTRLVTTEVSLANPSWSSEPEMVTVGRLEVSIELLPLLSRRIRIHELIVDRARVRLETDADGRSNWAFDTGAGRRSGDPPRIEVATVALSDLGVSYRGPALLRPVDLEAARLDVTSGASGALELRLAGTLNGSPLAIGGHAGSIAGLTDVGGGIDYDLEGRLGSVALASRGSAADLATLAGANASLEISGPDASMVTDTFGLPSLGDGAFELAATLSPTERGSAVAVSAGLGQVTAEIEGEVDHLRSPRRAEATVSAAGPDLAAAAALVGASGMPAEPFDLSGHVVWEGFPIRIDTVQIEVGDNRITADGVLGAPPRMLSTDLTFDGSGRDLASIGRLAGLDLPTGAYSIRGRIVRRDNAIDLEAVDLRAADSTVTVTGTLGDPPTLDGTDLRLQAAGPDLSRFSGLAGTTLPRAAFAFEGRLRPVEDAVSLDAVTARVGDHQARVEGTIATTEGLVGSDVVISVEGPDLSWPLGQLGIAGAPPASYRVEGTVRVRDNGMQLDGVSGQIGDLAVTADGRLGRIPSLLDSDVHFRLEGPDASWPAAAAGIAGIPSQPLAIEGRVRVGENGYQLDAIHARVGDAELQASGLIGTAPDLSGSDLTIEASAADLSPFDPAVPWMTLPQAPASASGRVVVAAGNIRLEAAVLEIEASRLSVSGTVMRTPNLAGSDLELDLTSRDLAGAGRIAAAFGLTELPELPAEPLTVTGHVAIEDLGYRFDHLQLTLGDATARADGRLGRPPAFLGTDLTLASDGPDASLVTAVTGVTVPVAPFHVSGRLTRTESGNRFDELRLRLGEYDLRADGALGEPPRFEGTDLELEVRGPSLALIQQLAGARPLPDLPFELLGRFDGNPRRFKCDRVFARLGRSDVAGWFRIDLEGAQPRLDAELGSRRVDLAEILGLGEARPRPPAAAPSTRPDVSAEGLVFSDDPISLDALRRINGRLRWTADEAEVRYGTLTDIELDARLEEGALSIDPIRGVGAHGGRLDARVELAAGENAHRLRTLLQLQDARIDLTAGQDDPAEWPTLDLELGLAAAGRTPHGLASSADGRVVLALGPGPVDESVLDLLAADLVVQTLELLNPFSGGKQARLECGVVVIRLEQGLAVLDPFAIQTDRTTLVGDGTVDLTTEDLDLRWITKPRRGLGISASTITNAYLKLGGTLANPKIETKPLEALATTGVAVATGGLSLLGRGLFDRISAERKVCARALEQAEKQLSEDSRRP